MTDTVVSVEHLSKQYRLGTIGGRTLRDDLTRAWARLRGQPDPLYKIGEENHGNHDSKTMWALRDVSFEVKQGEALGIIGRNGAGKSTLLKLLSRITAPTAGQVKVKGRVASLLEVGTGFHPELSGRENIYLNGAILGMRRIEIDHKFDEIVDFAEVENFIDTPVKRYSSGMYVRLAFAVAAHLEPEILVVDEVLAVGDAAFQKKCLGKMGDVARGGRTVLFVSHNMGAVKSLCSRCLFLDKGRMLCNDVPSTAIELYLSNIYSEKFSQVVLAKRSGVLVQVTNIWFEGTTGAQISEVEMGHDVFLEIKYTIEKTVRDVTIAVRISKEETPILYTYDTDINEALRGVRRAGRYQSRVHLPMSLFKEGTYITSVWIGCGKENLTDPNAYVALNIINNDRDLTHRSYRRDRPGFLFKDIKWDTRFCASE